MAARSVTLRRTTSALKTFWDGEAGLREADTRPQSLRQRGLLRALSPQESCGKTPRRGQRVPGERRPPSRPLLSRPRSRLRGKPAPSSSADGARPQPPPPSPLTAPPPSALTAAPSPRPPLAHLRWSKEWMLRAAFPCPPPTQLRERPNMLAVEGCSGPRALRPHSPAGRAGDRRAGTGPEPRRRNRRAQSMRGQGTPESAGPAPPPARGLRVPGSTAGGGARPSHGGAGRGLWGRLA